MKNRRSIRLKEYDYTMPAWFYVTLCSYDRENIYSEIVKGQMKLNDIGYIVDDCWNEIPNHFQNIEIDDYVIMPNHIHGIIIINPGRGMTCHALTDREFSKPIPGSLSTIIGQFKAAVTRRINETRKSKSKIWQRNYYEHIIRNERDLFNIRKYIQNNPLK